MPPRMYLLTLSSLAVVILSACAPATSAPTEVLNPGASPVSPPAQMESETQLAEVTPPVSAAAPAVSPPAVATSRGPDLEATDPTMVSLASDGLQLVEFFRFT